MDHSVRVSSHSIVEQHRFENEGQDSSIADSIVSSADDRYMVVTIKHSGSLVTLSGSVGFAAKNSLDNEYTAGAALVLYAHYLRLEGLKGPQGGPQGGVDGGTEGSTWGGQEGGTAHESASARLSTLMTDLVAQDMALSFEMVTGHHGHHGQVWSL